MSAVFLSDVDDYLSPSQACVNPLFSGSTNAGATSATAEEDNNEKAKKKKHAADADADTNNGEGNVAIVPRSVRRRRTTTTSTRRPRQQVLGAIAAAADDDEEIAGTASTDAAASTTAAVVTASIADCLACSGCVTTAETVLLERHSLDELRRILNLNSAKRKDEKKDDADNGRSNSMMLDGSSTTTTSSLQPSAAAGDEEEPTLSQRVGMTISPASLADLLRRILGDRGYEGLLDGEGVVDADGGVDASCGEQRLLLRWWQRKLATLVCRRLNVHAVADGNLALRWSLQQSALEFCAAYRNDDNNDNKNSGVRNNNINSTATPQQQQQLPAITSSCPALVCLAEKTLHRAVPHLSEVKSPMSAAGALLWKKRCSSSQQEQPPPSHHFYHLAVMPCHDKKLEGWREDLKRDVEMVITTDECYQLLRESVSGDDDDDDRQRDMMEIEDTGNDGGDSDAAAMLLLRELVSSPPAPVSSPRSDSDASKIEAIQRGTYLTTECYDRRGNTGSSESINSTASFFPMSSGGYADYIFRYAALELFGFRVDPDANVWRPCTALTTTGRKATVSSAVASGRSARTAGAAQRRRQLYYATLYRNAESGALTGSWEIMDDDNGDNNQVVADQRRSPVLRFVIAHGMQTMQRALDPFRDDADCNGNTSPSSSSPTVDDCGYHYLEAMACPSGCINGGGQIRIAQRETPTQTRQRVAETQRYFAELRPAASDAEDASANCSNSMRTSYHAVAPLQHQVGAAAGVAVKDIQW